MFNAIENNTLYDEGPFFVEASPRLSRGTKNFIDGTDMQQAKLALTDAQQDIVQGEVLENSDLACLLRGDFGVTLYFHHDTWDELDCEALISELSVEVAENESIIPIN